MSDTANAAVIRRADYTPPAFLIDSVALEVDLVAERTIVKNTMRVRRNPGAVHAARVELMGEALELVSVSVDGAAHAAHHVHEHGLVLDAVPDAFELTIVSACNPAANTTLSGLYVSSDNFFTQC